MFQILVSFLCNNCTTPPPPTKKSPPLSQQPLSKNWDPDTPSLGSIPPSRKGGAHYVKQNAGIQKPFFNEINCLHLKISLFHVKKK